MANMHMRWCSISLVLGKWKFTPQWDSYKGSTMANVFVKDTVLLSFVKNEEWVELSYTDDDKC